LEALVRAVEQVLARSSIDEITGSIYSPLTSIPALESVRRIEELDRFVASATDHELSVIYCVRWRSGEK
jgi:hypothetical protein